MSLLQMQLEGLHVEYRWLSKNEEMGKWQLVERVEGYCINSFRGSYIIDD